jgi:dihydrodipicolinate synthase/N-acetylneuraminate lyase
MGERPALVHTRDFGLAAWTTGSGCIAPHAVMALFGAAKSGRDERDGAAQALYDAFLPLETLRDEISLIRVLHDAVTLSGIADMGPILPLLSATPAGELPFVRKATLDLLAFDRTIAGTSGERS